MEKFFSERVKEYCVTLNEVFNKSDFNKSEKLMHKIYECSINGKHVFICGNGGSAANAIHMANDFVCGIAKDGIGSLKATALPANQSIITCIANDIGYEKIFSSQLEILASAGDILIVLSGSGNSKNILNYINSIVFISAIIIVR